MKIIRFDFNNLFSFNVGALHGIKKQELSKLNPQLHKAYHHLNTLFANPKSRIELCLEWAQLPFQNKETIARIQMIGEEIAAKFTHVLFLGIGGSYLGLKAAQDALLPPYYNEFNELRNGRPKIYFEGNNLDPTTIGALLKNIPAKKTFIVVISKSGETTETKAAFTIVASWLKKHVGARYRRQIIAVTDPSGGALRHMATREQAKDILSFRTFPLLPGVGGRFSELNMGLCIFAITGIKIEEVLKGAAAMSRRCSIRDLQNNPAYMYAASMTVLYKTKRKDISILMPFSETLKSTADWYCQLLGESLGKNTLERLFLLLTPKNAGSLIPKKLSM